MVCLLLWSKTLWRKGEPHYIMTNTYNHAKVELDILSKSATDPENRPIIEPFTDEILALCEKFGNSGQSGGSAPYTATALANAIKTLCLFEPLTPITGIDDEWVDVTHLGDKDKILFQNKREGAIFKEGIDGKAYYLDAIVWKDKQGHTWSGSATMPDGTQILGRAEIKEFPFTPKTFYINVDDIEDPKDNWDFFLRDTTQLAPVKKYYNLMYK